MYFSFTSAKDFPNDLSVKIAKKIGLFLAFIAVTGILFSILGLVNIFWVENFNNLKYIIFTEEFKQIDIDVFSKKIPLWDFLKILFIEVASCVPDVILSYKREKEVKK